MEYDIIIIGSGLGGLECGAILSKEGYNVCVLEKNSNFGGCFQTYQRGNHLLDPGIQLVPSDKGAKPIPGMHGFSPDDRDSMACILSVNELAEHPREIADFFRLMKQGAFELKTAGA